MTERNIYIDNIPLAEAQTRWTRALHDQGCFQPVGSEEVSVDESLGRVTAVPVHALRSSPFYNASAMDGIAVRFRDTIGASETRPIRLREGTQFVRVNTGHPIPEGCDAVVMIENVHPVGDGLVEIIEGVTPWKHVRTVGEDIVATELILAEGHRIRPIDIGALLATGVNRVRVRISPRVAVIPTGSELVQPGQALEAGNIIEFNGRVLCGYLKEWGAEAVRHEIVRDDPAALREALRLAAEQYDIVVTNAGASAGTEDHTKAVLEELGDVVVHGVAIKPGKPVLLGFVSGKPVVGLPGYPVSAILTLRLFLRELISARLGVSPEKPSFIDAILSRPVASRLGVDEFIRIKLGKVGDRMMATPVSRGAGAVMSLVRADGILTVPAGSEGVGAGEGVNIELLRSLEEVENTLVFIGSHDNALDVLTDLLHGFRPSFRLSSAHVGSMGGILAIRRGEAHMAGTHLLDEETSEYNVPYLKRLLPGHSLKLVNLAYRTQGLLVPRGNPKGIGGVEDLARPDVSFINRQRGAGTRLLTDLRLKELGISSGRVSGYEREEYTHMNVASAVASGSADTGMAILAAASALDLDFIPVAEERYDLIVPAVHEGDAKVQAALKVIGESREFRDRVMALGGYDLRDCGRVMYEQ